MNIWDWYNAIKYFDGSPTVNEDVAKILKEHGHGCGKPAGCTCTMSAVFYKAGDINAIGGYANNNVPLVKNAKKAGIWHEGSKGILPGDIIVFARDGKTNHTEAALGDNLDISGNYTPSGKKTGCYRRKRSAHSSYIAGYVRPKFTAVPEFNDLQVTILAAETFLGTFGTGNTRTHYLSVFGQKNSDAIQKEVTRITNNKDLIIFDLAIYTIAKHAGKAEYRKGRLGKYADDVQKKINSIAVLSKKTNDAAAEDVIKGLYGNNTVREFLLDFNGYNANKIQKIVNEKLNAKSSVTIPQSNYLVYLSTKVKAADLPKTKSGIIALEPELYSSKEVQAIRERGYKALAYLSLGTNEKPRSWFDKYKDLNLQQLEDWEDEWYVDVRKYAWRDHLISEAKKYKQQGFDGWWLDNLDVYEYNKSQSMFNACQSVLEQIKAIGGYVMVNGGSEFFEEFMDKDAKCNGFSAVNAVTQEEVYSLIKDYDKKNEKGKKGIFGEQEKKQHNWYKSYMIKLTKHKFVGCLLEYTLDEALKERIIKFCEKNNMMYYISNDVDL